MHVHIIAPSSAAPVAKLNQGLEWLHEHGHEVELPKNLLKPRLFFAAPLEEQVKHVKAALASAAPVMWCLRGGYGAARLIPYLAKMKKPKHKKLLIGFSDNTALHLFLGQRWKWPTIHGRVLTQLDGKARRPDLKLYQQLLQGELKEMVFKNLKPMNAAARKNGTVSGQVTGGNLRLLECSIGTAWELEARGKIVFLEDVGERGYAIHRMLVHLKQAGLLEGVKAFVLGDFTEGLESDGKDRTLEALQAFADECPVPVLRGMPCGHGDKNHPLPFFTPARLTLGKKSQLSVKVIA